MEKVEWYKVCIKRDMKGWIYIVGLLFAVSCGTAVNDIKQSTPKASFEARVSKALHDQLQKDLSHYDWDTTMLNQVRKLYEASNYEVVWIDSSGFNDQADQLLLWFENAENYGLNTNSFGTVVSSTDDPFAHEIQLTINYLQLLDQLQNGFCDSLLFGDQVKYRGNYNDLILGQAIQAVQQKEVIALIDQIQPHSIAYDALCKEMRSLNMMSGASIKSISVPTSQSDSLLSDSLAKESILALGYWHADDTTFQLKTAIQAFQRDHHLYPDGVIGENTACFLSKNVEDRKDIIRLNLERLRWMGVEEGKNISVNIPSFELKLQNSDSVIWESRTVIGARWSKTPLFKDTMEYVEFNPIWNVPRSITKKELLRKQKSDSTYLDRNRYEIVDGSGTQVAAKDVDWGNMSASNFNYRIRQKSGSGNALGKMKFIFPNSNNVYIHDTNLKQYFKNEVSAYSHGCVRLENPLGLAAELVTADSDSIKAQGISAILESNQRERYYFNQPIPVSITYLTAGVSFGEFQYYIDVYEYDAEMIRWMKAQTESPAI